MYVSQEGSNPGTRQADWSKDLAAAGRVTSFGLDNEGELYTVNWDGQLHKIVPRR